jgi:hypothetical protein
LEHSKEHSFEGHSSLPSNTNLSRQKLLHCKIKYYKVPSSGCPEGHDHMHPVHLQWVLATTFTFSDSQLLSLGPLVLNLLSNSNFILRTKVCKFFSLLYREYNFYKSNFHYCEFIIFHGSWWLGSQQRS